MSIYKNNQEILNKVYQHFIVEKNPKSTNSNGGCCYNGTGCAVGCLLDPIDRELFETSAGNGLILSICQHNPEMFLKSFRKDQLSFLVDLQNAHDSTPSDKLFHEILLKELIDLAAQYSLKVPV